MVASAAPAAAPVTDSTDAPIPSAAIPLLSLAAFASGVSLRVTDALLPRLGAEFGVSLAAAAHVVTAFSIAYGVAQLFFGPLGDRHGKYRVVAWACLASAVTAGACAAAGSLPLLLAARFAAGAVAGALIPLSMAWIGDVVPYEGRQPVIARFLVGQICGVAAGVFVGGLAADHLGRRWPFIGLALLFIALGLALRTLDRRLPERARTTRPPASGGAFVLRRLVSEFAAVLARPWARVVLATVFVEGALLYGTFAFIASHLHLVFGLSLSAAGGVVMLFGLGGLGFAAFTARLLRRLGEVGMTAWGGGLAAAALGAIAIAPAWWWAVPACTVTGLGFYMLHNTLQTHATQMAPERRGAAVAAFASAFFLGQSAGVALAGWAVTVFGTRPVIGAGAVGLLLVGTQFSRRRAARGRAFESG